MKDLTKEEREEMLSTLEMHRGEMFGHLRKIEILVLQLGDPQITARMEAYWLPSIKGALGSENYPNAIMTSLGDTIEEIEDGLRGEDIEEVDEEDEKIRRYALK